MENYNERPGKLSLGERKADFCPFFNEKDGIFLKFCSVFAQLSTNWGFLVNFSPNIDYFAPK